MSKCSFDSVIIGGGMVGMTTAIAMADAGLSVAVIEAIPHPDQLDEKFDGRVSAISLGSKKLLDQIGAWAGMAAHAEAIEDIRVVDADSPAFLHYDHREVGNEPFGWIVENRITRKALFARGDALGKNLKVYAPARVKHVEYLPSHAEVTLENGERFTTPLVIAADGKFSKTREQAGIASNTLDYHQTAIVCTIRHSHPHHGLALERFLPIGPFAVLPMTDNRSSLVWTEPAANAQALIALPDAELAQEIQQRLGGYLGEVMPEGPRFTYPLVLVHAESYTAPRLALVGDAAHGIHPIAGQGVNLGFRDAAALAERLVEAKRLGMDLGAENTLARYAKWRSFDAITMIAVTDGLTRLFSNNIVPLALARRAGLKAVGKVAPLKRLFMRHAMGLTGDMPKLMRGEKL